ncbi:MAG: hypothetical protein E7543_00030 [Ruminococcaceae bacterium]|nr:hypothetical protein [Oscillospiraceae bacterium]
MKIGIAGSRTLDIPIPDNLIPTENVSMIYTGGAVGMDRRVRDFAVGKGVRITEILPEYDLYGKYAPLVRNELIVRISDIVYVFWDGKSRGTDNVINQCKKMNKPYIVFLWKDGAFVSAEGID